MTDPWQCACNYFNIGPICTHCGSTSQAPASTTGRDRSCPCPVHTPRCGCPYEPHDAWCPAGLGGLVEAEVEALPCKPMPPPVPYNSGQPQGFA